VSSNSNAPHPRRFRILAVECCALPFPDQQRYNRVTELLTGTDQYQ